jgi:hypothetical protein
MLPARQEKAMREEMLGKIIHFWPRVGAAQVELEEGRPIHVGDRVRIVGHGHDFVQTVESLEINHTAKSEGWPGEHVALAVMEQVHDGDVVYRINDK